MAQNIDAEMDRFVMRGSNGNKDRVTGLPVTLKQPLKEYLEKLQIIQTGDLKKVQGKYTHRRR